MNSGPQRHLLLETCTLLGCFVPLVIYAPLALAASDDPEAPVHLTGGSLHMLQRLRYAKCHDSRATAGAAPCILQGSLRR